MAKSQRTLELQPISYDEAAEFVRRNHRHNASPPPGWKFGVAVNDGANVVGVAMVGRPVSRHLDDGLTLEVNRCCTDGHRNAASMLYQAAWRAAKAMGYTRLVTYTMPSEGGASLRGAGWREVYRTKNHGEWGRHGRPRITKHTVSERVLWEATSG